MGETETWTPDRRITTSWNQRMGLDYAMIYHSESKSFPIYFLSILA